jgi:hypothetical protein
VEEKFVHWRKAIMLFLANTLMSFTLIFSALHSLAASPACRSVLSYSPAQADIEATIESLAGMRLAIDLNQSLGTKSPAAKRLSLDFQGKYQDLVMRLEGQKTEQEIRDLIIEKIRLSQSHNDVLVKEEITARQIEKQKNMNFGEVIPLDNKVNFRLQNLKRLQYLPASDSLLFLNYENLMMLSLQDQSLRIISTEANSYRFVGDKIVTRALFGKTNIYDVHGGLIKTLSTTSELIYDVSPHGKQLAIHSGSTFKIYDIDKDKMTDKEFTAWKYEKPKQSLWAKIMKHPAKSSTYFPIKEIKYISDDLIWVKGESTDPFKSITTFKNAIYEVSTGKTFELNSPADYRDVFFSDSGKSLLLWNSRESTLTRVNLSDLAQFATKAIVQPISQTLKMPADWAMVSLASENALWVRSHDTNKTTGIFNLNDLSLIANLHRDLDAPTPALLGDSAAFDPIRGRVFEIGAEEHSHVNYTGYFIRVWKVDENL